MYWLACAVAAQVVSMGFISYTVSHCDQSEHPYLSQNFKSFQLSGFGFALGDKVLLTRLKLAYIGDMLGGPVWAFGAVSLSNDKTRHELLTTAEDFVDTFGRSYFIPLEGSEDMEISSIVAGGGVVVASEAESRKSTTGSRFCHWERHKLSYGVERTGRIPFKKTDLLAIGSLETNNQCPLDEGQTFDHSIFFLRELAVEPAY
jgi:hypothetical protein